MVYGDIPLSFRNGLTPSRCSWKLLAKRSFIFPCRKLVRKVRPLDQHLGNGAVTKLMWTPVEDTEWNLKLEGSVR
jgi:hypothetical protein